MGDPVTISGLAGSLGLFQRVRGHRHSIDDAVTAWYALRKAPSAERVLDLGAGAGTVGMIVLHGLSETAHVTCVEAQEASFQLLRANLECNGLEGRMVAMHGDLRDLRLATKFELITGSPPYFEPGAGTLPRDAQKAHARFELRGNVGDYASTARRHLGEGGVFVYCFPYRQKQRGMDLVTRQGFRLTSCRDIIPTRTCGPLFSVFAADLHSSGPMLQEEPLVVEGDDGRYSPEMLELQASRGFGPQGSNIVAPEHEDPYADGA